MTEPAAVIFACVYNAGRSHMAAAFFEALADPLLARALSAGAAPGPQVHPELLEVMREVGIGLSRATPQRLTDELAQDAALLVTMGCGEACPFVPGLAKLDWALDGPKGQPFPRVRQIRARVAALVKERGW